MNKALRNINASVDAYVAVTRTNQTRTRIGKVYRTSVQKG